MEFWAIETVRALRGPVAAPAVPGARPQTSNAPEARTAMARRPSAIRQLDACPGLVCIRCPLVDALSRAVRRASGEGLRAGGAREARTRFRFAQHSASPLDGSGRTCQGRPRAGGLHAGERGTTPGRAPGRRERRRRARLHAGTTLGRGPPRTRGVHDRPRRARSGSRGAPRGARPAATQRADRVSRLGHSGWTTLP